MAEANLSILSGAVRDNLRRLTVGVVGATTGENALNDAAGQTNRNVEVMTWPAGTTAIIPDEEHLLASFAKVPVGNTNAFAVVLPLVGGGSKVLYLSTLKKSAVPYDKFGNITGEPVMSHTAIAEEARNAATQADVYNVLKQYCGKQLKVTKSERVQTARYDADGNPNGTRMTNVPFFEIIDGAPAGQQG